MITDALSILAVDFKVQASDSFRAQIDTYRALLEDWNEFSGLMAPRELRSRFDEHVVDSLALVPYILKSNAQPVEHADLGSGGGFPAIPIHLLLPDENLTLIERSERKSAFLIKAVAHLALSSTKVITGSFPEIAPSSKNAVFTARAIERPEIVFPALIPFIEQGSSFLSQNSTHLHIFEESCRVERIEDAFSQNGMRRGVLSLITAKQG